jgi:outer membrane lipoprotein LolB
MWWGRLALVLSVVLTGCATTPPARQPLDTAQQTDRLLQLMSFSLEGKVSVAPQGFSGSVNWQQQQSLAALKLSGPFGSGSMQLEYTPTSLHVSTSRGDRIADGEAEALLVRELGFLPPFGALRYWVLGLTAPAVAADETHDEAGLLQTLSQQDWVIRIVRRVQVDTAGGSMQLPAELVVTRGDQRLKLVVTRWRIK